MSNNREYVSVKVYINETFKEFELKSSNVLTLQEKIIKLLLINPSLTLTELSRSLGYISIPNSLRRNLDILLKNGTIIKENKKYKYTNK